MVAAVRARRARPERVRGGAARDRDGARARTAASGGPRRAARPRPRRLCPGARRGLCRPGRRRRCRRGDRHGAAQHRCGRGRRRAPAAAGGPDRPRWRAVPGHRRGGAPGGCGCGRADRRRLRSRVRSHRRPGRHLLRQRAGAGRPVLSRPAVGCRRRRHARCRLGRCPRSSPASASTASRSTSRMPTTPGGCAPACHRTGRSGPRCSTRRWHWWRRPLRCCWPGTPSTCCPRRSTACPPTPCRSSPRPGCCRTCRWRAGCASCTVSRTRRPVGRWRGCRPRGSGSRRRYRPWVIAAPPATASSGGGRRAVGAAHRGRRPLLVPGAHARVAGGVVRAER